METFKQIAGLVAVVGSVGFAIAAIRAERKGDKETALYHMTWAILIGMGAN